MFIRALLENVNEQALADFGEWAENSNKHNIIYIGKRFYGLFIPVPE